MLVGAGAPDGPPSVFVGAGVPDGPSSMLVGAGVPDGPSSVNIYEDDGEKTHLSPSSFYITKEKGKAIASPCV